MQEPMTGSARLSDPGPHPDSPMDVILGPTQRGLTIHDSPAWSHGPDLSQPIH